VGLRARRVRDSRGRGGGAGGELWVGGCNKGIRTLPCLGGRGSGVSGGWSGEQMSEPVRVDALARACVGPFCKRGI